MSWQDDCSSWISRISSSRDDEDFNDVVFEVDGEEVKANRTILSMASPVMKTAFYGPLAEKSGIPICIMDGTPRGFKAMLDFVYNDGEYSIKCLLNGNEEISECGDLNKLMELAYFGHKYQINTLLVFCRNIIIYKVKLTIENVISFYKTIAEYELTLDAEYAIVSATINKFVDVNFVAIFKDASIAKENYVSEALMLKLLRRQTIENVTEGFMMQVALNYVRLCKEISEDQSRIGSYPSNSSLSENLKAKTKSKKRKREEKTQEELNWMDMARRFIPQAISFSKLSLKELDLTGTYNILPKDILAEVFTKTTEANKNGLVGSSKRKGSIKTEVKFDVLKNPLTRVTSNSSRCQVKLKVNQKGFFQFNIQDQRSRLYGNSGSVTWPYKSISWKPDGGIKEVATHEKITATKFFAEPNRKVTLDIELVQECAQFYLNDADGAKFMDQNKNIEVEILEVSGQPIQEVIAFDKGVIFGSLNFFPL